MCFIDRTLNIDPNFQIDEVNPDDRVQTKIYTLKCNVNTRPEIIYDDTFDDSPTMGTYRDDQNNIYNFLCFNLKPETQSNACFYNDLKDSSGNYNLNINGTDYPFKFVNGKPVFQSDSFKSSKDDFPFVNYINPDFETKDNPVYFLTGKKVSEFNITVTDEDGLQKKYFVSGATSGKYKLTNPTASQNGDVVIISTDCRANAISGSGSTTAKNVSVEYTLNGVIKTIPVQSGKALIYIPGGTSTITYKTTCGSRGDIKPSDEQTFVSHLDNKLYVTPSPENADWAGGSSSHPTTLTKAVACLNGKGGEWELHLASGTYTATENDMVTGGQTYSTWVHITGPDKVIISGPSAQNHATIDANSKGRVLSTNGTELEIENVNFTGGLATAKNGGGLYVQEAKLTLNNCTLYGNVAGSYGGAIYYKTSSSAKSLSVVNTTIGDLDHPNQATEGGGLYISVSVSGSTIQFKNSIIGSTDTSRPNDFANIATFNYNTTSGGGGGIKIDYGDNNPDAIDIKFEKTSIKKNKSARHGGGIYICQKKTVIFDYDCEVSYNNAVNGGGGIFLEFNNAHNTECAQVQLGDVSKAPQDPSLHRMKVNNNEAKNGAAVYCSYNATVYVKNTQINNNITTEAHRCIIYFESNVNFYNWSDGNTITEIKNNTDNQNGYVYGIYFNYDDNGDKNYNFLDMSDSNYFYIPYNSQASYVLKEECFTYGSPQKVVTSNFTLVYEDRYNTKRKNRFVVQNGNITNTHINDWDTL